MLLHQFDVSSLSLQDTAGSLTNPSAPKLVKSCIGFVI
jgi:hypothetical protein